MDLYLYLDSTQCLDIYPSNTPWSFKVQFNTPLNLSGLWMMALTEFHNHDVTDLPLDVYCDRCDVSIIGSLQLPILRRIFHNKNSFENPYYRRINLQQISNIGIDIKTMNGEFTSFLSGTSYLTLHLKRYPFLR